MFPLRHLPLHDWHTPPRSFGSRRANGSRKHAGVDLYGVEGEEVLAIAMGTVIGQPYLFYEGTWAIEVFHPTLGIVRYGELLAPFHSLNYYMGREPMIVMEGEVLGTMAHIQGCDPMLHLELFKGDGSGPLTDYTRPPFYRRGDLMDPTETVDWLASQKRREDETS